MSENEVGREIVKDIAGNSGELIVKSGGDDTTGICAGTVAANLVDYFSNYYVIFATYSTLQTVII